MNKQTRIQVYDKFSGHCAYCGCKLRYEDMHVDHIVPVRRWDTQASLDRRSFGTIIKGKDEMSNYYPSCRACNVRKGTLSIEDFRTELEECHSRMMKASANYRQLVRYGQIKLINAGKVTFYFENYENNR